MTNEDTQRQLDELRTDVDALKRLARDLRSPCATKADLQNFKFSVIAWSIAAIAGAQLLSSLIEACLLR